MKIKVFLYFSIISSLIAIFIFFESCRISRISVDYQIDTLQTNMNGKGNLLEISFRRGSEHNHPLMALWLEDTKGNYLQTLYVAKSIAKAEFEYADNSGGKWMPGPIRRPAALPVWAHSRGVIEEDSLYVPTQETAIPDAYTGPTPPAHFILLARTDEILPEQFYLYFEINQTWDWNEYWTNNKFPEDEDYKSSAQPALVYRVLVDQKKDYDQNLILELIGHSHYNGKDGKINDDLSSITTAKDITESVTVKIK